MNTSRTVQGIESEPGPPLPIPPDPTEPAPPIPDPIPGPEPPIPAPPDPDRASVLLRLAELPRVVVEPRGSRTPRSRRPRSSRLVAVTRA